MVELGLPLLELDAFLPPFPRLPLSSWHSASSRPDREIVPTGDHAEASLVATTSVNLITLLISS